MGRKGYVEDRCSVGVAEEAVAAPRRCGLRQIGRLKQFARQEVAQVADLAVDDHTQRDGLIIEILHHHRLVVVREECHLRRALDISSDILAHSPTDDVECPSRIVVEVAEVIGNSQHKKHTLRIGVS